MIRLIADVTIPFLKGVLDPFAEVLYLPGDSIDHAAIAGADGLLVRTRTRCDEKLLHSSSVKFIATATIGFDHIDTAYCRENLIQWTNAAACNASSVYQYMASALVTLAREKGFRLQDKTLGIVGVGNVGSKTEKLARLLGMKVLLNDPPRERLEGKGPFVSLDDLLQQSDMISLHTPLNIDGIDKTFHLIDKDALNRLKPGSWIINTARGEVIDSSVLKKALSDRLLGGVILDVWENEPHPDEELLQQAFIATPHIAGYSAEGKANGTAMVVRAVSAHFHFPLQDWYPALVPAPADPLIKLDAKAGSTEEMIRKAILHTYNIREDDARLRADIQSFELQRKHYPARREFPAFRIQGEKIPKEAIETLLELGFSL